MFTGIVSGVGEVLDLERLGERDRLTIGSDYDPASIAVGASIANAGVCLTVVAVEPLGERKAGDAVNIEVDQMARYAARLIEAGQGGES